jgi:hypothetical protein
MEIDKLIEGAGTVRFINAQRIEWFCHIKEWTKQDQLEAIRLETHGN